MKKRVAAGSLVTLTLAASPALAAVVGVSDAAELQSAIAAAQPGDEITLAPGSYALPNKTTCSAEGIAGQPIVVRAEELGDATIELSQGVVEGFLVSGAYWVFENLVIEGQCSDHSQCEHAFHLAGDADQLIIRNNIVRNFNAQLKSNKAGDGEYPDDVLIEHNELYNETIRNTSNPVTPIDVVGGRRWIVRANYIHDFAKGAGNEVSYAAFLKGNSRDGIFERNLVLCEQLHSGQVRLGLSFGGGGSSPDSICEDGTCTPEHQNGIMRNNVIANCPSDVGIYINEGANTRLYNNTLYQTTGIDFRFDATTGEAINNILMGSIRDRDGASSTNSTNVTGLEAADFAAIFSDPGASDFSLVNGTQIVNQGTQLTEVTDDFCRNDRDDGANDIGAVEYDGDGPCDTTKPFVASGSGGAGGGSGVGGGGVGEGGAGDGGSTATAGGAVSGTGGNSNGSGGEASTSEPAPADEGCGCAIVRASPHHRHALVLLLLGLGWLRRRVAPSARR